MKAVTIHTDGGCHGNPGPGAWAAILRFRDKAREISGGALATTNNRMEIQAALEALRMLKEPCEVTIFTDSTYVRDGITKWILGWRRSGWISKTTKKAVKNQDLWRALDEVVKTHKITWQWLKGHAGHKDNERCDELANKVIAEIRRKYSNQELDRLKKEFVAEQARIEDMAIPKTAKLFLD